MGRAQLQCYAGSNAPSVQFAQMSLCNNMLGTQMCMIMVMGWEQAVM